MSYIYKKNFLNFLIPAFLSGIIIYLSLNDQLWLRFWATLNVPAAMPPFSDFDAINIFLSYKEQGFNPYIENPDSHPIHSVLIWPSIWLYIADFLNLQKILHFKIFSFLILFFYFYVLFDFANRINNKKFNFILFFFFLSTSNFLVIERLNTEIIIFCFIYFILVNKRFVFQFFFFALSLALKLFPIFSIFVFVDKKKYFFFTLAFSLFYFYFIREEIFYINENIIEYALIISYGVVSVTKGIYYYSTKFDYFINDDNYALFKNIMIIAMVLFASTIVLLKFTLKKKKTSSTISLDEKMFLSGAGIYIGTFIFSANIDYRLIYLLFTIPFLLNQKNNKIIFLYLFSLAVCFNSLIIEGGDTYTLLYFFKAFFVYLLKLLIFIINCYYFGKVLNKFINVKFFN